MKKLAALLLLIPSFAAAQALPNITSLGVRYNTQKTAARAEGELKTQLDEIDKAIAEARRTGNIAEMRRNYAHGFALLNHEAWTPQLDYKTSLVLRSDRTVIDSTMPYALRLEQIYRPAIDLTPALTTKVTIRHRVPAGAKPPALQTPKELGTFDGVSRDLRDTPFPMELDLTGVEDGAMIIEAEVFDGDAPLGSATLGVFVNKGLDARLKALEAASASVAEAVRADVAYPADFIRNVNRGRIELLDFNVADEVARAEAIAAAVKPGPQKAQSAPGPQTAQMTPGSQKAQKAQIKDPFQGRTGDFERHYLLQGANEIMPYRVYVPKSYSPSKPNALVIALHGLGGSEDGFFDNYEKLPPQLAEEHGILLAAPLGFRRDGFYGSPLASTGDAATRRIREFSEQDVLEVLRRMKAAYNVDESRIYLMGHSMGAIGAWYLGSKYSQVWAAIVAFSGTGATTLAENMKAIPQFVVHGDADNTVNVAGSRTMVAALKKLNADVTYLEVVGGSHTNVVVPNLPLAFDFMAGQQKKGAATATKQ